jgi:hypothetical protein
MLLFVGVLCKSEKGNNQYEEGNWTVLSSKEIWGFGTKQLRFYLFNAVIKGDKNN